MNGRFEPIAIIGLACRFPGAADPAAFWKLLAGREDAIGPPGSGRFAQLAENSFAGVPPSGFLESINQSDITFLGISRSEAARMDPRQLLMLELAWEAADDAGLPVRRLRSTATGIFVGAMWPRAGQWQRPDASELSMIAGRASHHYGLLGPSVVVDTSTSSSLVAVHQACQALRGGDATLAIAGGINIFGGRSEWDVMSAMGALSPNGTVRPFAADANGYARGEGGGLVVLKPLDRALEDGDRIYCAILGGEINHNGATPSLAAPNRCAQRTLLERAYAKVGVEPKRIAYIEAHGSGTRAGDEAEWHALADFASAGRYAPLSIGSVKANVGHLEGAAGIAGLIKLALAAQFGEIPPTIHVSRERFIGAASVCVSGKPWLAEEAAGVTSLGLSGTNVHLVLERVADGPRLRTAGTPPWIFAVSAHTDSALAEYVRSLLERSENWTDADLPDICYTAAVRREHQAVRHAFECVSMDNFREQLRAWLDGAPANGTSGAARAFMDGKAVVWDAIFPDGGRCISLPPYPWQREPVCARQSSVEPDTGERVRLILADVLGSPAATLDGERRPIELGLDSLSALDMETRLEQDSGVRLGASVLLGPQTLNEIIQQVNRASHASSNRL